MATARTTSSSVDTAGADARAKGGRAAHLPPPGADDVLYLIDLSGYVFRAYHALPPLSSSKGEPTHAVLGTVNMLQKVVNERRPRMLAVAMDSRGRTFRHELFTGYKATRVAPPPDLSQQLVRCEAIVRAYNVPIYRADGVEADDLIACVVARARAAGVTTVVVSSDKDLMQLVDDEREDVLMWDSMRDRVYGPQEVRAKLGVPPSLVRDYLALCGDTSDNVPGVPSVGPKTAVDLLSEFGSIDAIYAALDKVKKPKLREALATHEADARLSRTLVSLRDDCVVEWDPAHLRYGGADDAALRELFLDLEFNRLLELVAAPPPVVRNHRALVDLPALTAFADSVRATKVLGFDLVVAGTDIVGIALSSGPGDGAYLPLTHRYLGAPPQIGWAAAMEVLAPLFRDPVVRKTSHALKANEVVLARRGVVLDGPMLDTQIASYLLDPETPSGLKELARKLLGVELRAYVETKPPRGQQAVGFDNLPIDEATPYAAPQAEISVELAAKLEPRLEQDALGALMRDVEMPLSRVLAQMELVGVLVDVAVLADLGRVVEGDLRTLEAKAKELAGVPEFSVRSRDQLEKILFDELQLPVLKRTPKGGRSTDAEVLEELAERHPLPKVVCEFREIDKLKGTYIDALPRAVNAETGRIHTKFNQTVAATGRLSSNDPNLQNIPIRTELGRRIRAAFVAPPGASLVVADYSQIELRVLAHLSRDPNLSEAFSSSNEDVHTHTASLVFGVPKSEVTAEMRRRAKTINFGVIYGMGDNALARQLDITRAEAASFIEAYFTRYERVARFMEETVEAARKGEGVRTILGRRRFLPNLHSANRGLRAEAERVAKNTPIQGSAADILKVAMVTLGRSEIVPGARMILTVHDELVFEVPDARVDEAKVRIREAMEGALKLDVPLVVDIGAGKNWDSAKK